MTGVDIGEFVDARVAECPDDPAIQACGMAPGFARKPVMGGGAVVVIPRETPRLVTSADLGLTSEDLMTLASKPGPSVLDTMRNQPPIDAVTALRALQDRLRDAPWGSC